MKWIEYNKLPPHIRSLINKPKFKITFSFIVLLIWCFLTFLGCLLVPNETYLSGWVFMFLVGFVQLIFELLFETWQ